MAIALDEAFEAMRKNEGGPFGAVIVKDNEIIARAHNQVIQFNDPTCHAEMQAIRKSCAKLGTFDLSDCELYTTCEPCPMCFGAIHWAKIKKIYTGCTAQDAEAIGFSDKFIYDVIRNITPEHERQVTIVQEGRKECLEAFEVWKDNENKVNY
jgi:guanine deaminase